MFVQQIAMHLLEFFPIKKGPLAIFYLFHDQIEWFKQL